MKRVSVIGCPGSGKTTFSRELSCNTNLPLVHLDFMYHDQAYSYQTDKDSWRSRVLGEAKKKQWIIDGNYKSTFDIRLPKSDTIIFLDYPTYLSIWRAIRRRIHFRKKVREDMPPTWKERLGWNFFVFILKFNYSIAPRIRRQLKSYKSKNIIVLKTPHQAKMYLAQLN
ncbi:MAG: AAA family ATPase [Candidatus Saccharimonadales bacterium]